MKTLVIDARMIGPVGHGIAKYLEELVDQFGQESLFWKRLLSLVGASTWNEVRLLFVIRPECPIDSPVRRFSMIELDVSCYHPQSWISIPNVLRKHRADLFFNPTFASYPALPCPFVQAVHDLNHVHFGTIAQKFYYQILLRHSIKRAVSVFTVSRFIRSEILKWAELPESKVEVFYNPISAPEKPSQELTDRVLSRFGLSAGGFFLSVSNPKPHKNLHMLISAHAEYCGQAAGASLPLVVTVRPGDFPNAHSDLKLVGGVSSEELRVLYHSCKAFFFPSLYEGFGRPPVEAALSGAPVFASDIPPHREAASLFSVVMRFLPTEDRNAWRHGFLGEYSGGKS